jgi:hypothetical protein
MDSQEIKEILDEWLEENLEDIAMYTDEDLEKSLGKWKRLSKKKNADGEWERVFSNTYLNKKMLVVDESIKGFLADGQYVFDINSSGRIAVSDYECFKKNGHMSDWHLSGFVVFPDFVDEEMEGYFCTEKDISITKKAFLDFGFVEDEKFSQFMSSYQ